jgi:hypothetical protein
MNDTHAQARDANRLYGPPASIQPGGPTATERFELYPEDPPPVSPSWDKLKSLDRLAEDLWGNLTEATAFAENPNEYLRKMGYEEAQIDLESVEVRMALASADRAVRASASQRDVPGFLAGLQRYGLMPFDLGAAPGRTTGTLTAQKTPVEEDVAVIVSCPVIVVCGSCIRILLDCVIFVLGSDEGAWASRQAPAVKLAVLLAGHEFGAQVQTALTERHLGRLTVS